MTIVVDAIVSLGKFPSFARQRDFRKEVEAAQPPAGGTSICRNFGLQKMFSFIGYVERAGSGADTITKGWKENNWPKPQIREIYDPDRVEMVLSLHGLEGDLRKDGTTQKTTTETTTETTIETFKKTSELILDTIKKNPSLTNKELAAICGITTDGVYYQL